MTRNALRKIAACLTVATLMPVPAQAQWPYEGWGNAPSYRERRPSRPKVRPEPRFQGIKTPEPASRKTEGPLFAVISIADQKLSLHDATGLVARSPVSTGMAGHRTPTGIFSVIQKNRHHRSNIYSGAPMPFMQRITWSGIALHEGALPGYPASHGCIRLPRSFASELWGLTRLGVRVVISPTEVAPVAFQSASLPRPAFASVAVSDATTGLGGLTRVAAVGGAAATDASRALNPAEAAVLERSRARIAAADAVKAAKLAHETSLKASAQAREAAVELRRAEARLAAAPDAQRAEAEAALTAIRTLEDERSAEAYAAANAARDAEAASDAAASASRLAERAVEPLQVFISRKERRLYVRQGFTPMFNAAVTFKSDTPVGTHLYSAVAPDETGSGLRWTAISVTERGPEAEREPVRRGQPAARSSASAPVQGLSAAAALDQVEIPADVMRKLGERLWVGASIIVSDHPTSSETGLGTDFIVLTK